ncbi:hypothetical protein D3C72_1780850 [compost metagenome]
MAAVEAGGSGSIGAGACAIAAVGKAVWERSESFSGETGASAPATTSGKAGVSNTAHVPAPTTHSNSSSNTSIGALDRRLGARCLTSASGTRPSSAARMRDESRASAEEARPASKLGIEVGVLDLFSSSAMRGPVSAKDLWIPRNQGDREYPSHAF